MKAVVMVTKTTAIFIRSMRNRRLRLPRSSIFHHSRTTRITRRRIPLRKNPELYKALVKELSQVLERQFSGNLESRAAGMVMNTMGWIENTGYELLLHSIDTFKASVVLVLGQEKLFSRLKDVLKGRSNVDVLKLHKSGGVVARIGAVRQSSRNYRIHEYFYGLSKELSPFANTSNFIDLQVFRIGGGPPAPQSALPIGSHSIADPLRVAPVNIDDSLLHSVLVVSYAEEADQVVYSNVAGFVYVTEVDVHRKKITYLSPSHGTLPSKVLVAGSLT